MPRRKPKDKDRSPDLPHEWIERHIERLMTFAYVMPVDLTEWSYRRGRLVGEGQYEEIDSEWTTIQVGDVWGGSDTTGFFKKTIEIPETHAGDGAFLDIDMDGGETQLSINGRLYQGLDYYRSLIPIGEYAEAGQQLELSMEAFIINYPYDERRHDQRELHQFKRARLLKRVQAVETAVFDLQFVLDAYFSYWEEEKESEIEALILQSLKSACRLIGPQINSLEEAQQKSCQVSHLLYETLFQNPHFKSPGQINVCAHSHLDLVYLWPIKETYRKNGRTTTNMLSLLREYPEYIYSQSQPYLYEKLKAHYPELHEEVRHYIKTGRWEVIGAMYIEPDGNLLGPESWVRQILFGKRFLQEEYGVDTDICWMPDVFGVLYTLPQILKKSGINYFLTAKLNIWNDTNVFPYDSFRWRGPDGSEVITHFPPTHFAQDFTVSNLRRHWRDYREKLQASENLFIYGWGDGGGGPTRRMVEFSLRAKQFPGLPKSKIQKTADFFHSLEDKKEHLPVWDDELYMEGHRGTYTSKGFLKRNNRKAELFYRDIEIMSVFARLFGGPRIQETLNEGWKLMLLNQFHDTLPGSHVQAAVPDIKEEYAQLFEIGDAVFQKLAAYFQRNIDAAADLMLLNTLSWDRLGLISCEAHPDAAALRLVDGSLTSVQQWAGKTWVQTMLPSMGWTVGQFVEEETAVTPSTAIFSANQIETPFYEITIDSQGNFSQIVDKRSNRELLSGVGNDLQVFEDDPGKKFGAWDIAYHFEEYRYEVDQVEPWTMVTNGPLFAVFSATWRVLNSTITQEMWVYQNSPRIDFKTEVDWQDSKKLLKVAFPLKIRSRMATYDLPFGHIERPTHRNTSWEQAKYEVCGHKWADLSEGDYGVALLNDCKYGYDIRENVIRLSLVRSPTRPTPRSDIGLHQFTYSLLPHDGNWRDGQVTRHAYELNSPAIGVQLSPSKNETGHMPATYSFLQVDSPSVIVEALKQAETSDNVIVRTFDAHGTHCAPLTSIAQPFESVSETDLLEQNPVHLQSADQQTFSSPYQPYEIKTFSLKYIE